MHNQNEIEASKMNTNVLKTGKIITRSKEINLNQSIDLLQSSTHNKSYHENPNDISMSTNLIRSINEPKPVNMDFIGNMKKYLTNTTNLIQNYSKPPKVSTSISKPRPKPTTKDDTRTSEKRIKDEFKDINE